MERPDKALEKDLNKLGVHIIDRREDIPKDATYLSIHVEVGFPLDTDLGVPDFDVMYQNRRGVKSWFSAFRTVERGDQKILMFEAYQQAPDNIPLTGNFTNLYASSYIDLCWHLGTKPVDSKLIPSVVTSLKDGAIVVDMGWLLPSRFVDSITEALGVLNSTILSGTLIEALIYGPFVSYKE